VTKTAGATAERFFHLDGWSGWRFAADHPGVLVTRDGLVLGDGALPPLLPSRGEPIVVEPSALVFDRTGASIAVREDRKGVCIDGLCEGFGCEPPRCWGLDEDVRAIFALTLDRRGRLFVALETSSGREVRVLRMSPAGEVARLPFPRPVGLAVGPDGGIYALDRDRQEVVIFAPDLSVRARMPSGGPANLIAVSSAGTIAIALSSAPRVRLSIGGAAFVDAGITRPVLPAIAFAPGEELLYLGDAASRRIVRYRIDGGELQPERWSAQAGPFSAIAFRREVLVALFGECEQVELSFEPEGFFQTSASVVIGPLDAGEPNAEWHRIVADVTPEPSASAAVEVEVLASDTCESFLPGDTSAGGPWTEKRALISPGPVPVRPPKILKTDLPARPAELALQNARGRFAFLRITLSGNGRRSPRVRWVRVEYPRDTYLRQLPAIFSEDPESRDVAGRFLSIFEAENADQSAVIRGLHRLFRPYSMEPEFLPWLAKRLAFLLDPSWTVAKRRQALAEVFTLYRRRGTRWALARYLELYGGGGISIVEGFRTRNNFILGADAVLSCKTVISGSCGLPRMQLGRNLALGAAMLDSRPNVEVDPITENRGELTIYVPLRLAAIDGPLERIRWIAELEAPAGTLVRVLSTDAEARLGQVGRLGLTALLGRHERYLLPGEDDHQTNGKTPRMLPMLLDREPATRSDVELGLGNRLGMDSRL
jgi:phage tail-like protein